MFGRAHDWTITQRGEMTRFYLKQAASDTESGGGGFDEKIEEEE